MIQEVLQRGLDPNVQLEELQCRMDLNFCFMTCCKFEKVADAPDPAGAPSTVVMNR